VARAPQTGSPAINAGNNTPCPVDDQRFLPRSDGQCDVGSVEVQPADTTPPVFSNVPADISVPESSLGSGSAVVSWTDPTATDAVDGVRSLTCTPSSGSSV